MITVFYDAKCGLCRREINHYMRIAPIGVFEWIDITTTPEPFTKLGFSIADGLKVLHVKDTNGTIYSAVDGFMIIWQNLPKWWVLSKIVGLPIVHPIVSMIYRKFATWRFNRLGYNRCKIE